MANISLAENINKIADGVTYYSFLINLSVGVPLNLVNVIVFTRIMLNKTNKTNMGFFGLCQSAIDLVQLFFFSISIMFKSTPFFHVNIIRIDFLCKLISFLRRIASCSSSWMGVFTTFDRFIFVIFGHTGRFKFMKQKRYLALIILGILIVLALVNIINLFFYISKGNCTADHLILMASDSILISTRLYIPIFLMSACNIYMIKIVIEKSRTVLTQTSNARKEYLFTISVIANDAFFLLFHLPNSIYFILNDINLYSGAFNGDKLLAANYNLFGSVVKQSSLNIQTFSFFIYLAFNKVFRKEILNLIRKII